jgi:hypothetical protein
MRFATSDKAPPIITPVAMSNTVFWNANAKARNEELKEEAANLAS